MIKQILFITPRLGKIKLPIKQIPLFSYKSSATHLKRENGTR